MYESLPKLHSLDQFSRQQAIIIISYCLCSVCRHRFRKRRSQTAIDSNRPCHEWSAWRCHQTSLPRCKHKNQTLSDDAKQRNRARPETGFTVFKARHLKCRHLLCSLFCRTCSVCVTDALNATPRCNLIANTQRLHCLIDDVLKFVEQRYCLMRLSLHSFVWL